jgi:hypothetical protein
MSLRDDIERWVDGRKVALVKEYREEGLKASGRWEKELTSDVTFSNSSIKIRIDGAHYTEYLVRGRGKGGGGTFLQKIIRQWIDDKGISPDGGITKDELAKRIAWKIHREGIRVHNRFNSGTFIDRVFYTTDGTLSQFRDMLKRHYAIEIKRKITQGL